MQIIPMSELQNTFEVERRCKESSPNIKKLQNAGRRYSN